MENVFILPIDAEKFRSTNDMWNKLMLNDPWSVGYVSSLIETKEWQTKEEWENFYYNSGEERKRKLESCSNKTILDDFSLPLHNKNIIYTLSWNDRNLNTQYGRTKDDLMARANSLYDKVKNNGYGLTLSDCFECVRIRTICETWNGIVVRENNTILALKKQFPQIEFRKTDGNIDHAFAVDYELFENNVLICGIQIKPKSYLGNAPYLRTARYANQNKYAAYKKLHNVDVLTVISKTNGEIQNKEIIDTIKTKCRS